MSESRNWAMEAERLLPYLLQWLRQGTASGGGTAPALGVHDLSGSLHLGALGDSQAPQFLKTDGTRDLTGNLGVKAGVTIDGVDLSEHAADPAAHHAPATAANAGISVSGQAVGVAPAAAGSGLGFDAGTLRVLRALNSGLAISLAGELLLGTPIAVAVGSANGVVGDQHSHAVVSSSNPGATASLLATNAGGFLGLVRLTLTDRLQTSLIDTGTGNLTIQPASDLVLSPGSNLVKLLPGKSLQSDGYASQVTGMRISHAGEGDFRYLYTDELHAESFIVDLEQALAGGQIIGKSVAVVANAFAVPAAGAAATLRVRDLPSAANMAVFQSGDIVRLRQFSRAAGSLTIADCWGAVTGYADGTGANEGTQTWTFTRSSAPNAGAMAAGTVVQPDSLALDYGTTGNGFYEVNAIDGAYGLNSPYAQIVSWATHPATGQTVRSRLGNLRGIFGAANEYGLYAGAGTGTNDAYFRMSNTNAMLQNIPIDMYIAGTRHLSINPSYGIDIRLAETEQSGITWRTTLGVGSPMVGLSVFASSSVGASLYSNINDINKEAIVSIAAVNQAHTPNSVSLTLRRGGIYSSLAQLNANVIQFGQSGGSGTPTITSGGNTMWHAGNDGSGSGLDADLLDGQQGSYYLPAASYTAADVRAKLLSVDGSGSGLDADLIRGFGLLASGAHYNGFPIVAGDGVMEIGRYIDFHESSGSTTDFASRLASNGGVLSASGIFFATTLRAGNASDLYSAKIQTDGNIHAVGAITSQWMFQVQAQATVPGAAVGYARITMRSSDNALVAVMPSGAVRVLATN